MEERVVFWPSGCEVYSGVVVMLGRNNGWTKVHGTTKLYDTFDSPDVAKRVSFDLNMRIGAALS